MGSPPAVELSQRERCRRQRTPWCCRKRGNLDDLAGIHLAGSLPAGRSLEQESQGLDVVRIIFAILLPPLGVFLQVGLGLHFWLNILLTILGYIPGIVHAIWIIARR